MELLGVNVRMLVVLVAAALNDAVTPAGSPETARATLPAKPFWPATPMVLLALAPPTVRDNVLAEEERLKAGTAPDPEIVSVIVRLLVVSPEVPRTVIG
jgi:hypothetical protein